MESGAPSTEPSPGAQLRRGVGDRLRSSRLGQLASPAAENLRDPARVIVLLLLAALLLRGIWLNVGGLIFDEAYYVNAARVILGVTPHGHYADSPFGLDPNTEHPPLGKLAIAASIAVFGDNGFGWRVPSVIAAMVALIVIFEIVRRLDRSAWFGILVVALVAFDNLTFVHGRIGTLDMLVLAPMLVGSWLALQRRWVLAGVAIGIALLVKLTALYAVLAIALWLLFTEGPAWWRRRRIPVGDLAGPLVFGLATLVVALGGLTVLDARFTTFATPFDHLARMVSYGTSLHAPENAGFCPKADSEPWQWLFNECQIQYLRVDVTVRSGSEIVSSTPRIDFRGAFNPLLAGAIPLAALFTGWYAWRTRSEVAVWAAAWGLGNYVPYLALALFTNRIMYIYYALPLVPAIAVGVALLLLKAGLPRVVLWGFLLAYLVGFAAYFPFREIP